MSTLPHRYANGRLRRGYDGKTPDRLTIVVDRGGFVWEPDDILAALRRFARRHGGRTPTSTELDRQGTGACALRRGDPKPPYPSAVTVAKYFGSFNAGVAAAGLTPRQGRGPRRLCKQGHQRWYVDSAGTRRCRPCRSAQLLCNQRIRRAKARETK